MQDVDFVSGLPRADFESMGLDFDQHQAWVDAML